MRSRARGALRSDTRWCSLCFDSRIVSQSWREEEDKMKRRRGGRGRGREKRGLVD